MLFAGTPVRCCAPDPMTFGVLGLLLLSTALVGWLFVRLVRLGFKDLARRVFQRRGPMPQQQSEPSLPAKGT